ncbi:MAG TPA: DUF2244 domain-containing protein [Cycloclasticus sp.]|jgi:uncharacterized membrane protein|nr:DUF2244 domain-containing protein [Cycloclasticus sp.]
MGRKMVDYGNGESGRRYVVLMPNSSLSFRQAVLFFVGISTVSLTIALLLYFMGLWLVLPFSGLELLVLGYCLLLTLKKCGVQEVITITDKVIRVERGLHTVKERSELPLGWVRVELEKPKYRGHATSLIIKSHGKRIEVGRFLVESERESLAKQLKTMLMAPSFS